MKTTSCIFCKFSIISVDNYGYSFHGCKINKKIDNNDEIFPEDILCKNCNNYTLSFKNLVLLSDILEGEILCLS